MAQRIPRIAQLDPLRALAAFLVILQHYLPGFEIGHMPFGWIGVDLFFVISGYLITAILLKQKEAHIDRLRIIKGFVIKRALRLFPAYYALILFFVVMRATTGLWSWDPGQGIYYFTYTSNFLFFQEGFLSGHLNHLWSLAVEEQFYLVWPWFVLFVPRPWLSRLILLGLVFALVCKSTWEWEHIRMLPTSHFDTLGGGALLAIHGTSASRIVQFLQRQAGWVALLGLAGMIMCNLEIGTCGPARGLGPGILRFGGGGLHPRVHRLVRLGTGPSDPRAPRRDQLWPLPLPPDDAALHPFGDPTLGLGSGPVRAIDPRRGCDDRGLGVVIPVHRTSLPTVEGTVRPAEDPGLSPQNTFRTRSFVSATPLGSNTFVRLEFYVL